MHASQANFGFAGDHKLVEMDVEVLQNYESALDF